MPSRSMIALHVNGNAIEVMPGTMVSAAMLNEGEACRISVSGEARGAICGMGICFECRACVDGVMHQRTCQLVCRDGMRVETQR